MTDEKNIHLERLAGAYGHSSTAFNAAGDITHTSLTGNGRPEMGRRGCANGGRRAGMNVLPTPELTM